MAGLIGGALKRRKASARRYRLYRVEGTNPVKNIAPNSWIASDPSYVANQAARGHWYAGTKKEANYYRKFARANGETNIRMLSVSVGRRQYQKYHAVNMPMGGSSPTTRHHNDPNFPASFSDRPNQEWYLPSSVTRRAKVVAVHRPRAGWKENLHPRVPKGMGRLSGKFRRK
jgi:hypothetical protein